MSRLLLLVCLGALSACAVTAPRSVPPSAASSRVVYMDLYADPDADPLPTPPPVEPLPHAEPVTPPVARSSVPIDDPATPTAFVDVGVREDADTPLTRPDRVAPPVIEATPAPTPVVAQGGLALAAEPVPIAPAYTFDVRQGEFARNALERWCTAHDVRLVWQSSFDIPLIADATFPASTLRDAVSQLLRAIYHPRAPLIAEEHPNNVLVIRQP